MTRPHTIVLSRIQWVSREFAPSPPGRAARRAGVVVIVVLVVAGLVGGGAAASHAQIDSVDAPTTVGPDEHFAATVTVSGTETANVTLELGDSHFEREVDLSTGSQTLRFDLWAGRLGVGDHTLRIRVGSEQYLQTITVAEGAGGDDRPAPPSDLQTVEVPAGATSEIVVDTNVSGTVIVAAQPEPGLELGFVDATDGDAILSAWNGTHEATIVQDADRPALTYAVTPPDDAEGETYAIGIRILGDDRQAIAVIVSVTSDRLAPYRDGGEVTLAGLSRAVADWGEGEISTEVLGQVVAEWGAGS